MNKDNPIKKDEKIEMMKIKELKESPNNASIYGEEPVNDLVESIKSIGIQQPIVIAKDNTIVAGHRRFRACKELGMSEVPVIVRAFESEEEMQECMIECNTARVKTNETIAREYIILKSLKAKKAKDRQRHSRSLNKTKDSSERGTASKLAATQLKISHDTAEKGAKVVEHIDKLLQKGEKAAAEEIRNILNKKTINTAYKHIRRTSEVESDNGTGSEDVIDYKARAEKLYDEYEKALRRAKEILKEIDSSSEIFRYIKYGTLRRPTVHNLIFIDNPEDDEDDDDKPDVTRKPPPHHPKRPRRMTPHQ
jgi:ParB/RepB/Spo0J family partition protein